MLKFFDQKAQKNVEIPIEKIVIKFLDPDTGQERPVFVSQIVVGDLGYENINKRPFVYDKEHGYLSIGGDRDIMMQRLEKEQIQLIESVLEIKERMGSEADTDTMKNKP